MFLRSRLIGGLLAALSIAPLSAWAADDHHHAGDIAVSVQAGQLFVGGDGVLQAANGFKLYEAEFGDQFVPYQTNNPGFQTQGVSTLTPGAIISFEGQGSLSHWNGSAWSAATGADFVTLRDAAYALTTWRGDGVAAGATSYVAQVSAAGGIHSHLQFATNPTGNDGAYLVQLRLTSATYQASDPFYVVLNYGLEHEAFEQAVGALVSPVPEPASYALMLLGVAGISGWARRRRAH